MCSIIQVFRAKYGLLIYTVYRYTVYKGNEGWTEIPVDKS